MSFTVEPPIADAVRSAADRVRSELGEEAGSFVEAALLRTLTDTITLDEDSTAFVITGDIPAMWLRDSTTQMLPYLRLAGECEPLADVLAAVVRRQLRMIAHDPYANSANLGPTGAHHDANDLCQDPMIWEQKYEVDSLAFPIIFGHRLLRITGRDDLFDDLAHGVLRTIVDQWRLETEHEERSQYRFVRDIGIPTETLDRDGLGSPLGVTGMTWSAFRPSDDACTFGYNVPANLQAAQALIAIADVALSVYDDETLAADADALRVSILEGVAAHGVVEHEGSRIYAYEVDGLGGQLLMDDANMPSLLSLPLDAPDVLDPQLTAATRAFCLGMANPYRFSGAVATGIGSPHTPQQYVWPIAFAVEGLTGTSERGREIIRLLLATDGGTDRMHESFHVDDPERFTRPWFSWADAMFCELALHLTDAPAPARSFAERVEVSGQEG
ncbi:glycoside hydrolase family 125 protein [Brachybacterium subflavum]|uniref:glycoside hydrolase family 125 protein n=1 Tax=Brachybacterium subflavum TaxID=2585206 RepID=UPI001D0D225F|nr:glycoside hydrolase family 125 protein [Brachybacterium subflavum]